MLEVIDHDNRGPVVPVAFGPGSDWYKTLRANPSARITWGRTATKITAQILDEVEVSGVLARYVESHRWAARGLDQIVGLGLVADPAAGGNIHRVYAKGTFGALDIEVRGKTLPDNPKTSALAAYSVVAAIRRHAAAIEI